MASFDEAYSGFICNQKDIDDYKNKIKNMLRYRDERNNQHAQNINGVHRNNYFVNEPIIPVKKISQCQRCNGERIEIIIDRNQSRFKCKFCGYISAD